jgi:TRAP-type C4-dicarboxylate transport system permease small subunit
VSYVTMLGTAVGVRDAGHIGLESFLVLAPEWLRNKLEVLIHLFMILFGSCMAYYGLTLAIGQWDEMLPTLGIADGFRYIPIGLCGVLMTLFSIEHIIAQLNDREVVPAWH